MKVCPHCQVKYNDETLNFCLEDGTVLEMADQNSYQPPETVMFDPPDKTQFKIPFETEQTQINNSQLQAPKSGGSKTWLWIVGIVFGLMLVCGGGFGGLALIGMYVDDADAPTRISDFSEMKFQNDKYITTDNSNGKLTLTSRDGYYYVFVFKEFPTNDASVKLTVTNKTGKRTTYGYGLVVQSEPTDVLENDYAFLIDSNTGEYRVARHEDKDETEVIKWTQSSAINKGSAANELEVKCDDRKMKFYVNGKLVKTVTASNSYKDGVAGVYTSDEVPIAFSNLELRK